MVRLQDSHGSSSQPNTSGRVGLQLSESVRDACGQEKAKLERNVVYQDQQPKMPQFEMCAKGTTSFH